MDRFQNDLTNGLAFHEKSIPNEHFRPNMRQCKVGGDNVTSRLIIVFPVDRCLSSARYVDINDSEIDFSCLTTIHFCVDE